MTSTESAASSTEQDRYNEVAVANAARIHAFTSESTSKRSDGPARPLDELLRPFNRTALGVALEYERMGNQPVSDELAAEVEAAGFHLEHLGITLGTVIHGIDLNQPLSNEQVGLVRRTLLERKVIFFRDQHLAEERQVAFARRFGELDAFPFGKPGEDPYILEIIHGEGSPGFENSWHTDVTWMERPSLGSIAQCIVVPPYGGDTLFSDSHAALLGLPAGILEQIEPLYGINDYRIFLDGRGRGALPDELIADIKDAIPFGVAHPLVRTHPETGKKGLYLHGGFIRHESLHNPDTGEQLDEAESRKLVSKLQEQHTKPEYQCRFQWEPGSIAFWDNRAVQHYATSDYYPQDRLLRRVTVAGDRPF